MVTSPVALFVGASLLLLLLIAPTARGPAAAEPAADPRPGASATRPTIAAGSATTAPSTRPVIPRMRAGLAEALSYRAAFSRAHRGPYAASAGGDADDSSDVAAGWHAGERVAFVWHQQKDRVVCIAFDKTGHLAVKPAVVGAGRWPRVTAEGGRIAVAWDAGDRSAVRSYDDVTGWGEEIPLTGREAAIAFAPAGGPLYAATSAGLWKLEGKAFSRAGDTAYSQAALVTDAKGQPHVAWRQGKDVMCDGASLGDGEHPTLAAGPDGTLHVAYMREGAIVLRSRKGDAWTEPQTIAPADAKPNWPALAWGEGEGEQGNAPGLRLTWLGAADLGPDALWLARLPDTRPVMMPSLAGNVTDAWLLVRFQINGESRWGYRPHDVRISVNGDWLKWFRNTIPEGRYLFPLDPATLATSAGGRPAFNDVRIDSWHMNGGHYITGTDYQVLTRTAWGETFAFAADEQEARQAADRPNLNHDKPDLAVLANGMDVPAEPPPSGKTDFKVVVVNLGEAESRPAGLVMLHSLEDEPRGKPLARAEVPALRPGERWTGTLQLQGRVNHVTFKLQQGEPDFDPSNDSLTLALWSKSDAAKESNPVATVAAAAEATVAVADPRGSGVDFVVKAADGKEVARSAGPSTRPAAIALKPGKYVVESGAFKVPLTVAAPPRRKTTSPQELEAAGERYAWLSQANINPNNANLTLRATDGAFHRWYNSRSLYDGPLGFGWTFDYGERLGRTPEGVYTIQEITGFQSSYVRVIGEGAPFYHGKVVLFPSSLKEENGRVVRDIEGDGYQHRFGQRVVREEFEPGGKLLAVRFADGTEHEVRYEGDVPRGVFDKASGKAIFTFAPGPAGRIGAVIGRRTARRSSTRTRTSACRKSARPTRPRRWRCTSTAPA